MKVITAVIRRQGVGLAVERKLTFRDAITVTANDGSEVGVGAEIRLGEVAIQRVKAQHDIVELTLQIGRFQRHDDAAVVDHPQFNAIGVGELIDINLAPIGQVTKDRCLNPAIDAITRFVFRAALRLRCV